MTIERQIRKLDAKAQHIINQNDLMFAVLRDVAGHFVSPALEQAVKELSLSTKALNAAMDDDHEPLRSLAMTNPTLDSLKQQVERTTGVVKSATAFINGFGQRLADAIAAALQNGATAEELAPLQALSDNLKAETDALAAAIAANP